MSRRFCGYTWDEMNRVLDLICSVEDHMDLTGQQENDYDIAVQCVALVMNRMKDNRPIIWEEDGDGQTPEEDQPAMGQSDEAF